MPVLRNVDVFVKARADIRTQSASGGLITLLAACTAFLLFVGQIYVYIFPNPVHTLHLSESMQFPMLASEDVGANPYWKRLYNTKGTLPFFFKVTFLHLPCGSVDVMLNNEPIRGDDYSGWGGGNGGQSKKYKKRKPIDRNKLTVRKYSPRSAEIKKIFGSESSPEAKAHKGKGCTLIGNMKVPLVAGTLSIVMTRNAWSNALNYFMSRGYLSEADTKAQEMTHKNDFNVTHFVHEVRFGKTGGKSLAASGYVPPLEDKLHKLENDLNGVALQEIRVKLIPTVHSNPGLLSKVFGSGNTQAYQMSVVDHTIQPETMVAAGGGSVLPGISMSYDVMPLAVHIDELNGEGGFFGFLATLIGIVGGCFVTVGLFAGCAVKSVQAVAKKID
mmetsp:Transcript_4441/g.12843  ORF Transcript_4441/g.12843 Transcript_4441/m.12843 type:complete len:387 (+) Transcript_4441:399-1559(+)|eukprot:CAMPEP_0172371922 /NCGR_PEP_ID=MMETSP1060-20121228/45359_1 /TAXON_ID=37318 /ORGANISM="Pseudo-nitzschia pungens, Strain cf. cingulata" /LENGTH=386 /DNA_ID=CAMNT_0013097697 /DNA_START=337 /DNA_END=1497 /DNA_ORIENTATION=+